MKIAALGPEPHRRARRYLPALIALVLGVLASVALFRLVQRWEETRSQLDFEQRATRLSYAFEQELNWHGEVLRVIEQLEPLASRSAATDPNDPTLKLLREFVQRWMQERPAVRFLGWSLRVPAAERPAFEAGLAALGMPNTHLLEWQEDGLAPAGERDDYYPVLYVEPQTEATLRFIGFDQGSVAGRREAITRAVASGVATASAAVPLVEGGSSRPGVVVALPAFERGSDALPDAERDAQLVGVVVASLDLSAVLNAATAAADQTAIAVRVRDLSDPERATIAASDDAPASPSPRYTWSTTLTMWGRQWEVTLASQAGYQAVGGGGAAVGSLLAGLSLSVLLAGYLATANRRAARMIELAAAAQREVAERQRAEAVLRQSEARFRALVQHSSDVTLVLDERGTIRDVSESVEHIFGYRPADLLGQSIFPYLHPDDADGAKGNLARVLATPGLHPARDLRVRHADGSWRLVESTPSNLLHDPAVGGIVYNARDISERYEAETERRHAEDLLRQSEGRFRSLVQHSTDITIVLDAAGAISYTSPAIERVLGYRPEAVLSTDALDYVHPDDLPAVSSSLAQVAARAGAHPSIEFRLRHADGSWRRVELTATNLLADPAIGGVVQNIRDITERRHLEEQLIRQAFYDPLTGLPNRALFLDRLSHALALHGRRRAKVAVVFIDLDNFKVVNDSLGHAVGDSLLEIIAQRLRETVRPGDTVARFAGDEFTVLLDGVVDEAEAVAVAERLVRAVSAPVHLVGHEVVPGASVGVALGPPTGTTPDALLRNADLAMYSAKQHGKGQVRVFDQHLSDGALERLELEGDLRRAVERGEFRIAYQPIVELDSGALCAVEALVRWLHPRRGEIAPAQFISLAEETGLIVPLGYWILEEACRQARRWQVEHPDHPPLTLSVNLSARQFQHRDVVDEVERVLRDIGLPPTLLNLEITESVAMEDAEATIGTLRRLKALGVQLAIDDFGTGYSSLSYLRRFPVDTLKVDRSFVRGIEEDANERAIVRSVVALARSLNLHVTAEGIETEAQLQQLRSFGCDRGQGFLLAVPLNSDAVSALLASRSPIPSIEAYRGPRPAA